MDTPRLYRKTQYVSKQLSATIAAPTPICTAPKDVAAEIRGYIYGTIGEFGYLSNDSTAFATAPKDTNFPFYPNALALPTGNEKFHVFLAPDETLYGFASIADGSDAQVWISYHVNYIWPDMFEENPGGGPGGGGRFRGPSPHFMKG